MAIAGIGERCDTRAMRDLTPNKASLRARREFSHAHMSDTKWRKMFTALNKAEGSIQQMIVKFIDVDEPRVMRFPSVSAVHQPWPYIDTEFGPVELRAIEWVEFPAIASWPRDSNLPSIEVKQDIQVVSAILAALRRYPLEPTPDGVRVLGYSR